MTPFYSSHASLSHSLEKKTKLRTDLTQSAKWKRDCVQTCDS